MKLPEVTARDEMEPKVIALAAALTVIVIVFVTPERYVAVSDGLNVAVITALPD
jgi:hypothetical protein